MICKSNIFRIDIKRKMNVYFMLTSLTVSEKYVEADALLERKEKKKKFLSMTFLKYLF